MIRGVCGRCREFLQLNVVKSCASRDFGSCLRWAFWHQMKSIIGSMRGSEQTCEVRCWLQGNAKCWCQYPSLGRKTNSKRTTRCSEGILFVMANRQQRADYHIISYPIYLKWVEIIRETGGVSRVVISFILYFDVSSKQSPKTPYQGFIAVGYPFIKVPDTYDLQTSLQISLPTIQEVWLPFVKWLPIKRPRRRLSWPTTCSRSTFASIITNHRASMMDARLETTGASNTHWMSLSSLVQLATAVLKISTQWGYMH